MNINKVFPIALLLAGLSLLVMLTSTSAFAHGSTEPQHGGVVIISGEMSFELVTAPNSVKLYLLDDGDELDTSDLSAKLKLKNAKPARFIDMQPSGGNSFSATGVTLKDGDKILALVTLANGYSKIGANFTIGEKPKH
jgi:hypothetical protein